MPNNITVFISSTSQDLKQDCRKYAIATIRLCSAAQPVAMEDWFPDHTYTVKMCLDKIEQESTHFLGIFAHRYGWRPGGPNDTSITEKEYDHALKLKRPMFILIPDETSAFYVELKLRAQSQPPEDAEAQKKFLARVTGAGKTCRYFASSEELTIWVTHKIYEWQNSTGGLRAIAAATRARQVTPARATLNTLGREEQTRACEDCLKDHVLSLAPEVACFLVHGQAGYGHEEMLDRLQHKFSDGREVIPIRVDAGAAWRSKDPEALLEVIGQELAEEFSSVAQLAARLKQEMEKLDVIIRFDNLQRLNVALADFITGFWRPLAQSFTAKDADLPHRLIGLAGFKGTPEAACEPHLFHPHRQDKFDNVRLIVLPKLDNFTQADLLAWLKQMNLPAPRAKDLAQRLFQETQGNPPAVFQELMKDAIWNC
jgi:hypothetical protein